MLELFKIVHMGALMGGAAAGVGNGLFIRMLMSNQGPPPDLVRLFMKMMGLTGLISMVLLWLSGIGMVLVGYQGVTLGWMFWVKLIGATIALIGVVLAGRVVSQAEAAGTPPDLKRLKGISNMIWTGVILAVVFGVLRFN